MTGIVLLPKWPNLSMATIIAIYNLKGGVAKTTSVLNIAAALVAQRQEVLCLDLDSSGNLTNTLLSNTHLFGSIEQVLWYQKPLEQIIRQVQPYWYLAPNEPYFDRDVLSLPSNPGTYSYLKEQLQRIDTIFDYILIDCPSQVDYRAISALTAAQFVFIPSQPQVFSLQSLELTMELLSTVQSQWNPSLQLGGIFFTQVHQEKQYCRKTAEIIQKHFPEYLLDQYIHLNNTLSLSPIFGKSIFHYDTEHRSKEEYSLLTQQIVLRCQQGFIHQEARQQHSIPST